jgi:hypothetical protein
VFGHHTFVALGQRRCVQRRAGPDDPGGETHFRNGKPFNDLCQQLAPPRQRLTKQAAVGIIEQVEHHVVHRTPTPGLGNPPRIGQAVPTQQT